MTLCKDCQYYHRPWWQRLLALHGELCTNPKYLSKITGTPTELCAVLRTFEHLCGPTAVDFIKRSNRS